MIRFKQFLNYHGLKLYFSTFLRKFKSVTHNKLARIFLNRKKKKYQNVHLTNKSRSRFYLRYAHQLLNRNKNEKRNGMKWNKMKWNGCIKFDFSGRSHFVKIFVCDLVVSVNRFNCLFKLDFFGRLWHNFHTMTYSLN